MSDYDVIVVGGGAAGLTAALVLSRARRTVLVLDGGAPRNAPAARMHGYLSRDGMPPADLLAVGRSEVSGYGGIIIDGTVTDLMTDGPRGFWVLLDGDDGNGARRISARRLLITTGLHDVLPDIPACVIVGLEMCCMSYCHGHEVAGRRLGVIGGTPGATRYAQIVRQWTDDLVYFTPPGVLTAVERTQLLARSIGVVEGAIDRLQIDAGDRLSGVHLQDGSVIGVDALFVPPRFEPNNSLLTALGCRTDSDGWVTVDPSGRTSVPGVWAAGNVVDPRAQVITAAGAGSASAIAMNADLVDDDVRGAVRDLDHGLTRPAHLDITEEPAKESR